MLKHSGSEIEDLNGSLQGEKNGRFTMKTTPTAELLATGRFFLSSVTKHDFKGFAIHPFQFFFSSITRS